VHSATVIPRMPASFAPRRAAAFLLLAAVACLVLAACSPGADYLFPSVHDIPSPRTDTPLDSNQVQQATEDLISARDRLSVEAQDAHGKNSSSSAVKPGAKSAAKSAAKSPANSPANSADKSSAKAAADPAAARKQPSTPVSARQTLGTDAEQTAGTETK
jgi:colicin import membrane protein